MTVAPPAINVRSPLHPCLPELVGRYVPSSRRGALPFLQALCLPTIREAVMLRPFLLVCWLFSALALGFGSTPLAAQNPVKGVWTVTSVTQKNLAGQATEYTPAEPGLFIFTDRHFSRSVVFGPNLRKPFSERTTEAETIAAFTPVHMQAGTYELNGDRLTTHITVARNPAGPEGRQKVEHAVRIVGEFLYLTHTRLGAGLETIFKLRKVE